jgi:hypothetical protein
MISSQIVEERRKPLRPIRAGKVLYRTRGPQKPLATKSYIAETYYFGQYKSGRHLPSIEKFSRIFGFVPVGSVKMTEAL